MLNVEAADSLDKNPAGDWASWVVEETVALAELKDIVGRLA